MFKKMNSSQKLRIPTTVFRSNNEEKEGKTSIKKEKFTKEGDKVIAKYYED
jgi:hypothetical protein